MYGYAFDNIIMVSTIACDKPIFSASAEDRYTNVLSATLTCNPSSQHKETKIGRLYCLNCLDCQFKYNLVRI